MTRIAINIINILAWLKVHLAYMDNKQLLDEVEHDIMNYQNRGR